MTGFGSPDFPAYICYLVVAVVGAFTAISTINRLLDGYAARWRFPQTWLLFGAHLLLPVLLFWILDYTDALHDTSLFAALVVAVAYRQIFAGGVQGITVPGQTSRLWAPFENWVNRLAAKIAARTKSLGDKLEQRLRLQLGAEGKRLAGLRALAFEYTKDRTALEAELKKLDAEPAPEGVPAEEWERIRNRERAQRLVRELRASRPGDYADLLYDRGLIGGWLYHWWTRESLAKLAFALVTIALLLVLSFVAYPALSSEASQIAYHRWRFTKPNATERDRFRSREFLAAKLQAATGQSDTARAVLVPLLRELRFDNLTPDVADNLLRLVIDRHSRAVNEVAIPELIEALRTPNDHIRLRIQRGLRTLQEADYPRTSPDSATLGWVPRKEDTPGEIDRYVQSWQRWWEQARRGNPPPGG